MRTLIVDGYNVIRQAGPYAALAETDLDAARAALVSDVIAYAHGELKATVVFDGHLNPSSDGRPHTVGDVTVVFSGHGVEADSVIESLSRVAREAGDEVVVVTSDAVTQWTVVGGRVVRMSSAEFAREIRPQNAEWRDHAPAGRMKITLDEQIAPDVRARLERWARGMA